MPGSSLLGEVGALNFSPAVDSLRRCVAKMTLDAASKEGVAAHAEVARHMTKCAALASEQGITAFFQEQDGR